MIAAPITYITIGLPFVLSELWTRAFSHGTFSQKLSRWLNPLRIAMLPPVMQLVLGCGSFRFTVKFNFTIELGKSACAPKLHFKGDIERRAA
jgi:hypothetical protein